MQFLEEPIERLKNFYGKNKSICLAIGAVVCSFAAFKTVRTFFNVFHLMRARSSFGDLQPGIVHLFIYRRWSRGPNFFPHCVKIETFLRLANIPYVAHLVDDSSLSPNTQMPFIVCDGMPLAGSDFIIQYLTTRFNVLMDDHLTPQERSAGRLLQKMVETRINNGLNRLIFIEDQNCAKKVLNETKAFPLSSILLARNIRRSILKELDFAGYAQMERKKHDEEFLDAVQSLERCLRQTLFTFGVRPTSFDCSVYAWLHVARELGPHGLALTFIKKSDTIGQYIDRMTNEAFRDLKALKNSPDIQQFGASA
ncbi:unnamed protein product [Phytomonas sp. Hart1]|nr:unnamed protein product [Phytomonas sp. Hart1]|eukprot:CCW65999.1 unnamed protein product [Phytomonas sp. isolate Hart1]